MREKKSEGLKKRYSRDSATPFWNSVFFFFNFQNILIGESPFVEMDGWKYI